MTTLVDLTRQLSDFCNELQRLVDTHLSMRVLALSTAIEPALLKRMRYFS